jgi:hypothetical protein
MIHRVGNNLLNYVASQFSRHPILDLCSGFWGLDLSTGIDREIEASGFELEAELFLKAYKRGLTVTQFPVSYGPRIGEAKLRAAQDGLRILLTILRVGRGQKEAFPIPGSSGSLLRDLLSIAVVAGSSELVLVSPPSRLDEAHTLARRFRGSGVIPTVVVAPPNSSIAQMVEQPYVSARSGGYLQTVVALPSDASSPAPEADPLVSQAVVLLPRSQRMIYVDRKPAVSISKGQPELPKAAPTRLRAGAYILESKPMQMKYLRWVSGLGTQFQVNGSVDQKELAMIGANSVRSSVTVWKRPPRSPPSSGKGEASPLPSPTR